jgi:hypothetical protein
MGIVTAFGRYSSELFLQLLGLEDYPQIRDGGRCPNYKGKPALTDSAFTVLLGIVVKAVKNLAVIDALDPASDNVTRLQSFIALSMMRLDQLSADNAVDFF